MTAQIFPFQDLKVPVKYSKQHQNYYIAERKYPVAIKDIHEPIKVHLIIIGDLVPDKKYCSRYHQDLEG
jgi:hypothetical protein